MTDFRRCRAEQGLGPREKREAKELSLWPYDAAGRSCVVSGTQREAGEESDCGLRQGTPVRVKAPSWSLASPQTMFSRFVRFGEWREGGVGIVWQAKDKLC